MRLTKLQQIQKITKQNQREPFKKSWKTTLVLLGGSVGIGAGLWTLPVAAATTVSSTPSTTTTGSVTTSAATSATSTVIRATASAVTAAPSSAATATVVPSSPPTSAASVQTSTATSVSSVASSTGGTGFVLPSLAVSAPSSSFGSSSDSGTASAATGGATSTGQTGTATSGSQAGVTTSAASQAASGTGQLVSSAASQAASLAALPDTTVVTFADAGLEANVQSDLKLTGPITLGNIRNFSGTTFKIGTDNVPLVVASLAGTQYLQALPAKTLISLFICAKDSTLNLMPLAYDRFTDFSINAHDMAQMDLKPITLIDPSTISLIQLVGSSLTDMTDYQNNGDGMTNAQLAEIAPWLTAVDQTSPAAVGSLSFDLATNSITDFSPLKGLTKPVTVFALGQRVNYATQPVNLVIGQPAVFTALPLTGLNGEPLIDHYQATLSGSPTLAPTDKTHPQEPDITNLGNGQFKIETAYPTYSNVNWFAYGLRGYYQFTAVAQMYTNFIHLDYPNGVTFLYDVMVYQPANWLPAPELNVTYTDANTRMAIQPAALVKGTTIGANYDLTPQTRIAGYRFDPEKSSSPTGKYTQDPQALTFAFERQSAAGITVNYVDTAGKVVAPSTTISGYVGTDYQSTPLTVVGYTYQKLAPTSLPVSGVLPLAAGTIDYVYTPNLLTRTIQYRDVTTDQVLTEKQVTGPYKGTADDNLAATLADYEAQGYQVVVNNVPSGPLFDNPVENATYDIQLAHRMAILTPTSPSLPAEVTLTRRVNRTINYVSSKGGIVAAPLQQTVPFTRNAVRDLVTGDVTYGPWTSDAAGFDEVMSPKIHNMTTTVGLVPAETAITASTPDQVVNVVYTPTGSTDIEEAPQSEAESQGSAAESGAQSTTPPVSEVPQSEAPTSEGAQPGVPSNEAAHPGVPTRPTLSNHEPESGGSTAPKRGQQPVSESPRVTTIVRQREVVPAKAVATSETIVPHGLREEAPSQPSSEKRLPQTSEQGTLTALIGLMLIALGSLVGGAKRHFKRRI